MSDQKKTEWQKFLEDADFLIQKGYGIDLKDQEVLLNYAEALITQRTVLQEENTRLREAAQELRRDMQAMNAFTRDKNISTFAKEAIARFDSAISPSTND
jgi:UDP-N-acetylglucosamine:LPS N-acetylglucosamine transferase